MLGSEGGSQQGHVPQTGGNDPNNYQSSGSSSQPQQQGNDPIEFRSKNS